MLGMEKDQLLLPFMLKSSKEIDKIVNIKTNTTVNTIKKE